MIVCFCLCMEFGTYIWHTFNLLYLADCVNACSPQKHIVFPRRPVLIPSLEKLLALLYSIVMCECVYACDWDKYTEWGDAQRLPLEWIAGI